VDEGFLGFPVHLAFSTHYFGSIDPFDSFWLVDNTSKRIPMAMHGWIRRVGKQDIWGLPEFA